MGKIECMRAGRRSGRSLKSAERFIRSGGGTIMACDFENALSSLHNMRRILVRLGYSFSFAANAGHLLLESDAFCIKIKYPIPMEENDGCE